MQLVEKASQSSPRERQNNEIIIIQFLMCLKVRSVKELPYVAGLPDGIGVDTLDQCNQVVQIAEAVINVSLYKTNTVMECQTIDFLTTADSCVGNDTEFNFSVLLNVSADGREL